MNTEFTWSLEHGMIVRRAGSGPEIVWIHGLGEWSVSFEPMVRHPAFAGFTHVLPDLPGYGRSPWPVDAADFATAPAEGSLDRLARHLASWLETRPPAILVGHSMGGVLATLITERIPARAVIDIDGNISRGDCTFSAQASGFSLEDFLSHGFNAIRAGVYADGHESSALRGYHAALTAASPHTFYKHATDLVRLSIGETLAPRLAALGAPSLFVAGVPDGVCAYTRELLDRHQVRWIGIEPAGHWVYVDQPDAFASAVAGFLREAR
jgi:pimeloyl-ACP methyl ester carboxylesterase